jgi:hypothetical protein
MLLTEPQQTLMGDGGRHLPASAPHSSPDTLTSPAQHSPPHRKALLCPQQAAAAEMLIWRKGTSWRRLTATPIWEGGGNSAPSKDGGQASQELH